MKILDFLKLFWHIFKFPIVIILIGVIVGIITNNGYVGFFTVCGLIVAIALFAAGRQLWWFITKTGDYEKTDNSKK